MSLCCLSLVHFLHTFMPGNDLCNNCERLNVVDVGSFRIIVFRVFFSLGASVHQGADRPDQGTSWQMSTTHGWRNHWQCEQEHLPPGLVCPEAGFCRCHRLHQPWWNKDVWPTLTTQQKLTVDQPCRRRQTLKHGSCHNLFALAQSHQTTIRCRVSCLSCL